MTTANTLAALVNSSSEVVVPSGGIQFADATNASGSTVSNQSNLIEQDGYEVGNFTPEVYDAATSGTKLTSNQYAGAYIKVGDLVTVHFYFYNIVTTGATPTSNSLYFRNLPFTANTYQNLGTGVGSVRCHEIVLTGGGYLCAQTAENTNYARIWVMGNNTGDFILRVQDVGNSGASDIEFSVTYRAV